MYYHPDGQYKVAHTFEEGQRMEANGWSTKQFPPPPPKPSCQGCAELGEKLTALKHRTDKKAASLTEELQKVNADLDAANKDLGEKWKERDAAQARVAELEAKLAALEAQPEKTEKTSKAKK